MVKRHGVIDLLAGESNLAQRVAAERKRRGLSYDELSAAMADAGCPTRKAALHRIEKGNGLGKPPRQISVDELLAFAKVFDLEIEDLLTPLELINQTEAKDVVRALIDSNRRLVEAFNETIDAYKRYAAVLATGSRDLAEYIDGHVLSSPWSYTQVVDRIATSVDGPGADVDDFRNKLIAAFQTLTGAAQTIGLHRADPEGNARHLIGFKLQGDE